MLARQPGEYDSQPLGIFRGLAVADCEPDEMGIGQNPKPREFVERRRQDQGAMHPLQASNAKFNKGGNDDTNNSSIQKWNRRLECRL